MGFAVKSTPAASAATIRCTTTAIHTADGSTPFRARYSRARAVHKLDQQRLTASSSACSPRTFRKLSCCPAKLAPGRSSAVAVERTARGNVSPLACVSSAYARWIACNTSGGILAGPKSSRISLEASSLERFASLASATIDACNALASINARYASVVMSKPGGTGKPARAMRANEAPLPPTSGRVADTSSSARTSDPLAAGGPGERAVAGADAAIGGAAGGSDGAAGGGCGLVLSISVSRSFQRVTH
ncbi:hypothetical protein WDL1P2_00295 (plasmid) [Variovorax sp. WDL1]|nr:hypothetical protein CHC07_06674 [Variovorax sp. B4]PNG49690.1 hypothetical protein CHC06_05271 [Variovorax sp. B2]VTV18618.1 hypothetical protein WDL1P2_00295 [Variovorax sp. WDL1]